MQSPRGAVDHRVHSEAASARWTAKGNTVKQTATAIRATALARNGLIQSENDALNVVLVDLANPLQNPQEEMVLSGMKRTVPAVGNIACRAFGFKKGLGCTLEDNENKIEISSDEQLNLYIADYNSR
eukprot:5597049-Prymnesium_polylepis.1